MCVCVCVCRWRQWAETVLRAVGTRAPYDPQALSDDALRSALVTFIQQVQCRCLSSRCVLIDLLFVCAQRSSSAHSAGGGSVSADSLRLQAELARAQRRCQGLIFQKAYLSLVVQGYKAAERETLRYLVSIGGAGTDLADVPTGSGRRRALVGRQRLRALLSLACVYVRAAVRWRYVR